MSENRELILRLCEQAQYRGELEDWQGMGESVEPGCGDTMRFYLKTRREIITEIGYTITDSACYPVKACAEAAARLAEGKPVMEAYLINQEAIGGQLGGLDQEQVHCAIMAELTLKRAILDYVRRRNARIAAANG